MMAWLRRGQDRPNGSPSPVLLGDEEDSPESLFQVLNQLIRFINRNAGRLPNESVVAARRVTDTLRDIIATSEARTLDIHAVISVKAIAADYLRTTLRTYLALDTQTVTIPDPSGHTPQDLLRRQIESLCDAATDVLAAAKAQDVDALVTQGNFLRAKFTRSDLDL